LSSFISFKPLLGLHCFSNASFLSLFLNRVFSFYSFKSSLLAHFFQITSFASFLLTRLFSFSCFESLLFPPAWKSQPSDL
jgi:hypothetical protein